MTHRRCPWECDNGEQVISEFLLRKLLESSFCSWLRRVASGLFACPEESPHSTPCRWVRGEDDTPGAVMPPDRGESLYQGITNNSGMALPIPTKLEEPLVSALDSLVADGFYQSRSEAIRDAVRRLLEKNYLSRIRFLRIMAEISAQAIISKYSDLVTDIILYGSVAGGQVSENSDIDILVLVSTKVHESVSQAEIRVHETTYPIALACGAVITSIVLERRAFLDLCRRGQYYAREIVRAGISLHGLTLNELRKQRVPQKG
jgi:Arc/MetJ-type ribon-helix-helix transcriptional regulator